MVNWSPVSIEMFVTRMIFKCAYESRQRRAFVSSFTRFFIKEWCSKKEQFLTNTSYKRQPLSLLLLLLLYCSSLYCIVCSSFHLFERFSHDLSVYTRNVQQISPSHVKGRTCNLYEHLFWYNTISSTPAFSRKNDNAKEGYPSIRLSSWNLLRIVDRYDN